MYFVCDIVGWWGFGDPLFGVGRHQGTEASSRGKAKRVIHRLRRLDADYLRGFKEERQREEKEEREWLKGGYIVEIILLVGVFLDSRVPPVFAGMTSGGGLGILMIRYFHM